MILRKCILTANDCYKQGTKISGGKPQGIVVHSTGANNTNIKRYVQPLKTDKDHQAIINDLGINANGNDWNRPGFNKCVHAFIGKNAAGTVETCQTLPFDMCCWGCGSGSKGSYNNNPTAYLQFEICEDGLTDPVYFNAVYKEATEFCAYLCKEFGINVENITGHYEAHQKGYGSNHSDPSNWFPKFNKSMDDFRSDVSALLKTETAPPVTPPVKPGKYVVYGVGKGDVLHIRSSASAASASVGSLNNGDIVDITEIKNNWGKHAKGWSSMSYLKEYAISYLVKVTADSLNIRKGPGTNYGINGTINDMGTYTIVDEASGTGAQKWGKLKSGAGWISLDYTKKL